MYPYNSQQYPMPTSVNINPYSGANGFQTAVPMPSQQPVVTQRPIIFGHPVNRVEDITANDVPMDGTSGYFPLFDESAIYKKSWNSNGTISTIKYVPVEMAPDANSSSEIEELKGWLEEQFKALRPRRKEAVG